MTKRILAAAFGALLVLGLGACGGGGDSGPTTPAAPPPAPTVAVTARGAGLVTLHPSAVSTWTFALETPVRVQETGGGTAKWNFARLALFLNGFEVERAEIGADILSAAARPRS